MTGAARHAVRAAMLLSQELVAASMAMAQRPPQFPD